MSTMKKQHFGFLTFGGGGPQGKWSIDALEWEPQEIEQEVLIHPGSRWNGNNHISSFFTIYRPEIAKNPFPEYYTTLSWDEVTLYAAIIQHRFRSW